jgi:hypothetical protein
MGKCQPAVSKRHLAEGKRNRISIMFGYWGKRMQSSQLQDLHIGFAGFFMP